MEIMEENQQEFLTMETITYIDLSPSESMVSYCEQAGIKIHVYDHHKSFYDKYHHEDHYDIYIKVIPVFKFDIKKSGTQIYYDEYFSKFMRPTKYLTRYVELVSTYDLWQEDSPDWETARNLQRAFIGMMDRDHEYTHHAYVKHQLFKYANNRKKFAFTILEKRIINKQKSMEQYNLKFAKRNMEHRQDGDGNSYLYFSLKSKISSVCSALLQENEDVDYIVVRNAFTDDGSHSLRSKNIDVAKIAEKWGGGGHLNAAGIKLDEQKDDLLMKGELHLV
jgi:oligoribonuclease NrnB/cAMP/cGMP phosphodiesterase (DHH superfamily)